MDAKFCKFRFFGKRERIRAKFCQPNTHRSIQRIGKKTFPSFLGSLSMRDGGIPGIFLSPPKSFAKAYPAVQRRFGDSIRNSFSKNDPPVYFRQIKQVHSQHFPVKNKDKRYLLQFHAKEIVTSPPHKEFHLF